MSPFTKAPANPLKGAGAFKDFANLNLTHPNLIQATEFAGDFSLANLATAAAERRWDAESALAFLLPSHPDNAAAALDAGITAGCFDRADLAIIFAGAVVARDYTPRAAMLATAAELRREHLWDDHPGKSPIDDGPVWWREKLLWAFRPFSPMPAAVRELSAKLIAIVGTIDAAHDAYAEARRLLVEGTAPRPVDVDGSHNPHRKSHFCQRLHPSGGAIMPVHGSERGAA